MLQLPLTELVAAVSKIAQCRAEWNYTSRLMSNGNPGLASAPQSMKVGFLASIESVKHIAAMLGANTAAATAQRAFDECLPLLAGQAYLSTDTLNRLTRHSEAVLQVMLDELQGLAVVVLTDKDRQRSQNPVPMGEAVAVAFPTAAYDIEEASTCLAFGRWTACVMHVMRVLEIGLKALAGHYGVDAGANWNQTLNTIETTLRQSGRADAAWAAEAGTHLRFVKNAWRNDAMHAGAVFDQQRAERIFNDASSFMAFLAARFGEPQV